MNIRKYRKAINSKSIYMITLRHPDKKRYVSKSALDEYLKHLLHNSTLLIHHRCIELGTHFKQLHMHMIGVMDSRERYSRHTKYKGLRADFKKIKPAHLSKVINYIKKDNPNNNPIVEDQILFENDSNHFYMFDQKGEA